MSLAGGVQARSLVAGDESRSRDVGYPIPKVALLGERPVASRKRKQKQREGLQRKVKRDAAEPPV